MLTEFGGIAQLDARSGPEPGAWGYSVGVDSDDFARRYEELLTAVNRIEVFSGSCYTQFTDSLRPVRTP